jgi:hypothetical protein
MGKDAERGGKRGVKVEANEEEGRGRENGDVSGGGEGCGMMIP